VVNRMKISLLYHVNEVRLRLLYLLASFTATFLVSYLYGEELIYFLAEPLIRHSFTQRLIYTGLSEGFLMYIKSSFFIAVFFVVPLLFYQGWLFLSPGSTKNERQQIGSLMTLFCGLFYVSSFLTYSLIFPLAWKFLLGFQTVGLSAGFSVQLEARVSEYVALVIRMILLFGSASQFPLLIMVLYRLGGLSMS